METKGHELLDGRNLFLKIQNIKNKMDKKCNENKTNIKGVEKMGHPTIYPTGATVYHPKKAWSGYTIYQAADLGALLISNILEWSRTAFLPP